MKPLPLIVTVVAAAPAVTLEGESEVTVGLGFDGGGGVVVFIDPPPPPQAASVKAEATIRKKTRRRLEANHPMKCIVESLWDERKRESKPEYREFQGQNRQKTD